MFPIATVDDRLDRRPPFQQRVPTHDKKKICYNIPSTDRDDAFLLSSRPQPMNAPKTEYGISKGQRMTSPPLRRSCWLQRLTLLAALVMCVGHSVIDTHLHLDVHEEETCTLCAISESGHGPQVGQTDVRPTIWRHSDGLPVVSATLCPRPYEFGHPRAPPRSIS